MKILQAINSLATGGAEKLVIDLIDKLALKDFEVSLLLLDGSDSVFLKKLKSKHPKIKIYVLGDNKNIYKPKNILKIRTIIKNYDLVHVHLFPTFYWVAFANLFTFKASKLLFTEHNTTNKRRNKKSIKLIEKFVYNQYHKIITISDAVDLNLKEHLSPSYNKCIELVYNGINLEEIKKASPLDLSEFNIPTNSKTILQVSSFTAQKSQDIAIKALLKLPENFHLILIGDGVTKEMNINLAKEKNVLDRTHFLGVRGDVPQFLKTVDFVVLASKYEGLSLASVEGLASGKPFLASNSPGLKEVVENSGILFENENDLSAKILELNNDHKFYNEIVHKCKTKSENYNIEKMVDAYIKIYNSLPK
ncbi:glycosyltransferase [Cellulophaga baltica]|uniref:glycosyltransferase n=1 Tax=Cellulophaga baltica TaxID=76594 RepID=UPI002494155C|nr:glycosyltransferase [Cellulophaga baltica]